MKTHHIVVLALGLGIVGTIGLGLFASYLTSRILTSKQPTTRVLVARNDFKEWTPIKQPEQMFDQAEIPLADAPRQCVPAENIADLKGRVLRRNIRAGDILTEGIVLTGGLLDIGPVGKLSFSVRVENKDAPVSGSRVDVMQSLPDGESKRILESVLVRAVDVAGRPPLVVATLEVTREEAAVLKKARDTGTLHLILRPANDKADVPPPPP